MLKLKWMPEQQVFPLMTLYIIKQEALSRYNPFKYANHCLKVVHFSNRLRFSHHMILNHRVTKHAEAAAEIANQLTQ